MRSIFLLAILLGFASATVYFKETFETDPFETNRWVISDWKKDSGEAGEFEWSGGLWPANENRKGLRTSQDAKFYAVSAKLDEPFDNTDKTLVFQMSVKHEQKIDCGGGYVKLLGTDFDQANFNGDTAYTIMFGPDICGYSTKKIHAILHHNGENMEKNSEVKTEDDEFTHVFTFIIRPDDTYEIRLDGEKKDSGKLKEGWNFEKPKMIKDPNAKKPDDWVDEAKIDDPDDVKPDNWDDEPEKIIDPEAVKPEDWDDEDDGAWEPPLVDNPEYKGEWQARRIDNPDYTGPWIHPEIDNPDYVEVTDVYKRATIGAVGIEIWQVKSGSVFSDILLADSLEDADAFYNENKVSKGDEEAAKKIFDDSNAPPEDIEDIEDFETDDVADLDGDDKVEL